MQNLQNKRLKSKHQGVHNVECLFVAFEKEISIIIARDTNHKTKAYQAAENNHVDHILDATTVPADITEVTRILLIHPCFIRLKD